MTRIYVAGMRFRRDKQSFEGPVHTLGKSLALQAHGDHPPTLLTRLLTEVEEASTDELARLVGRPTDCLGSDNASS